MYGGMASLIPYKKSYKKLKVISNEVFWITQINEYIVVAPGFQQKKSRVSCSPYSSLVHQLLWTTQDHKNILQPPFHNIKTDENNFHNIILGGFRRQKSMSKSSLRKKFFGVLVSSYHGKTERVFYNILPFLLNENS